MNLCVIPARGGSKRIPRKNIREFCGKPIIAWSIEAARKSSCFNHIIVSTDDHEIAKVALNCGAQVPFVRPQHLASDHATTISVIAHAANWVNQHLATVETICCLYPTAPFVETESLRRGLKILLDTGADYVVSVVRYGFPIQRAVKINSNGRMEMSQPKFLNARSQDLPEAWHDAGQFYWGKAQSWQSERAMFTEASVPLKIPSYRAQDIDTEEDWQRAELLFEAHRNKVSDQ